LTQACYQLLLYILLPSPTPACYSYVQRRDSIRSAQDDSVRSPSPNSLCGSARSPDSPPFQDSPFSSPLPCGYAFLHRLLHNAAQCSNDKHAHKRKKATPRLSKQKSVYLRLLAVFLLDPTKLLLYVHGLHLRHASSILRRVRLAVVRQCCLLPPRLFLWRESHTRSAVVYVFALTGKALEIVCDVGRVDGG
jgi:hypothetical protein